MDKATLEAAKHDPTLQIAPKGDKPDIEAVKSAYASTIRDVSPYVAQCRQNYETRYAIWNGQSSDNKKHSREDEQTEPTPWEGASDLRDFSVDRAINAKVAMLCTARRRSNMVAVPTNGYNFERAKLVGNFMRWLTNSQVPELDREDQLAAQYYCEKGVTITGQFWEVRQAKRKKKVTMEEIKLKHPQADIEQILAHEEGSKILEQSLVDKYAITPEAAAGVLSDLRADGEAEFCYTHEKGVPIIRAYTLDEDVFIPAYATDLETSPYVFVVRYFHPEKLRSFVNTDDWDKKWVEEAIKTVKGKIVTLTPDKNMEPISRNFLYRYQRFHDMVGVVYAYQRMSDKDGIPGIYMTVFNPDLPASEAHDGYAWHGLVDSMGGEYPFVLHRREFLSRRAHDSRGVPEVGKNYQDNLKSLRDAKLDAASISILPPMMHPIGRPPDKWGPGARLGERRPNEFHFGDRPAFDPSTSEVERGIENRFREYCGEMVPGEDSNIPRPISEFEVGNWLSSWAKVYRQLWKLWQVYGDDNVQFRVMGLQKSQPEVMRKGESDEDWEFYLSFDSLIFDQEALTNKIQNIINTAIAADKFGQVDWSKVLQISMENIDPAIAEQIIMPKDNATNQAVTQVQDDLTKISAGIGKNVKQGTPPELIMQVLQQFMSEPDVQKRYGTDEGFKARLETYIKEAQMQVEQKQNIQIGRHGTMPAQDMAGG